MLSIFKRLVCFIQCIACLCKHFVSFGLSMADIHIQPFCAIVIGRLCIVIFGAKRFHNGIVKRHLFPVRQNYRTIIIDIENTFLAFIHGAYLTDNIMFVHVYHTPYLLYFSNTLREGALGPHILHFLLCST